MCLKKINKYATTALSHQVSKTHKVGFFMVTIMQNLIKTQKRNYIY